MASSSLTFPEFSPFLSSPPKSSLPPCSTSLPSFSSNLTHASFSIHSNSFPKTRIASSSLNCNPLSLDRRPSNFCVFQNTLRDSQQSPAAALTSKEKLDIARQLAKLGVDTIETGFTSTSEDDFESVKIIAKEVGNGVDENEYVPVICVLSRCNEKDIKRAWEAVKYAKRPRIHTFIATSEIHMKFKLKKSTEEVLDIARNMVQFARSLGCEDVEFSPEDASRSDREFLHEILGEVIKAGATRLNIPHTVDITMSSDFGQMIADIKANTPGIENIIISTHCQNDLGLSTAKTIAGACTCARQVESTINIIGARARNASMEEVVMDLKCRRGVYTGINTQHIVMASKMVEKYRGLLVQPDKAIVGANGFVHESGIHQDGILKHKGTYEIISPEDIRLESSNEVGIVLGKYSGRHALRERLKELGYPLDDVELGNLFWRFKEVAGTKKDGMLKYIGTYEIISPENIGLEQSSEAGNVPGKLGGRHAPRDQLKELDDVQLRKISPSFNEVAEQKKRLVMDEVFQQRIELGVPGLKVTYGIHGGSAVLKVIDGDEREYFGCSVGTAPADTAFHLNLKV